MEIAVVSLQGTYVLVYGEGNPNFKGRVYVLYTGTHYDPLVGVNDGEEAETEKQVRIFPLGDEVAKAMALEVARVEQQKADLKAMQRVRKVMKCGGCGALCDDFQAHCEEVEHDDDFMYDCEEVEIVESIEDALPEGSIDLASPDVHSFYNTRAATFSNMFERPVSINGVEWPSAEHYFQAQKFVDPVAQVQVKEAPTAEAAMQLGAGGATGERREGWDGVQEEVLLLSIREKFSQHKDLAVELMTTQEKTIVMIDNDTWAGMNAASGVPVGKNNVGKALMHVRTEMMQQK